MSILVGLTPPVKERVCHVALKAKDLTDQDRDILFAAIANPAWSIAGLVEALGSRGLKLSRTVIERHRKGKCGC